MTESKETAEWNEIMNKQCFITDLVTEQTATLNGKQLTIGRYAVWAPTKNDPTRHAILEVDSDLAYLQKKYGVKDDKICTLAK